MGIVKNPQHTLNIPKLQKLVALKDNMMEKKEQLSVFQRGPPP